MTLNVKEKITEDIKKNDEDSDIKDIYNTNVGDNMDNLRKKVSAIPVKSKFKSNKEIFLDLDLKKFKKELTKIKDKINSKESQDNLSPKPKIKSKKSQKRNKINYNKLS